MGAEPDVTIRQNGDIVVIDLAKDIDLNDMPEIGEVIDELVTQGQRKVLINLGKVTFLASTGVSLFLSKWRELRKHGGDLRFVNVSPHLKNVFRIMEAHKYLTIHDTEDSAVLAFKAAKGVTVQPAAVSRVMQRVHDNVRKLQEAAGTDERQTAIP